MEWISKVLEASPLSVALLICVILALGMFLVLKWLITWLGKSRPSEDVSTKDLAALVERVSLLEHDMERLEPKMDQCIEELIEWRTVLRGLKESMDEKLDRILEQIGERHD